jgi:hypothetical protein
VGVYDVVKLNQIAEEYKAAQSAHMNEINTALQSYEKLYAEQGKAIADEWAATVYQIDTSSMDLEQAQQALVDHIDGLWDGVPQNIWEGFRAGWNDYFGSGGKGFLQLAKDAGGEFIGTFKGIFGIASPSTVFRQIAEDLANGFNEGLNGGSWSLARDGLKQQAEILSSTFDGMDESYSVAAQNCMTSLASGYAEGFNDEVNSSLNGIITNISDWMNNNFDGLYSSISSVGQNLMTGLANGIIESGSRALQAVIDTARSIVQAAQDVFSVQSPSKVFAEIGGYLTEGLALGIEGGQDHVFDTVREMSGTTINAMMTPPASPAAVTGVQQDSRLYALLEHYLPLLAQMEVTLNGVIVGQMAPGMNRELGNIAYYESREVMA